jgi:uroporphyrin-3 C-methyltransferase
VNTDISDIDRSSRDTAMGGTNGREPPRRGSALATLALVLALLLACGALAVSAWLWWQERGTASQTQQRLQDETLRLEAADSSLETKLDRLRQELAAVQSENLGQAVDSLQQGAQADRAELADLQRSLGEQLAVARSLQSAMDALHARLLAAEAALQEVASPELDAVADLDLAEVDYLLRLASERLRLFGDVGAADRALSLADTHLAALNNPSWLSVRQDIAAARNALARVELPDTVAIAAALDGIQARIPALPVAHGTPAAAAEEEPVDDSWWARLKGTLASVVTIRRTAEDDPTLSLEDADYLRQRLWLQLEMAHLALMRRDQTAFAGALTRAQETLSGWFAASDDTVRSVRESLDKLAALRIEADLPDISAPWNSLRALRAGVPDEPPASPAASGDADR